MTLWEASQTTHKLHYLVNTGCSNIHCLLSFSFSHALLHKDYHWCDHLTKNIQTKPVIMMKEKEPSLVRVQCADEPQWAGSIVAPLVTCHHVGDHWVFFPVYKSHILNLICQQHEDMVSEKLVLSWVLQICEFSFSQALDHLSLVVSKVWSWYLNFQKSWRLQCGWKCS